MIVTGALHNLQRLLQDKWVSRAFSSTVARKGKFKYVTISRKGKVFRFVRMHSIVKVSAQNGCEKYFKNSMAFDYLDSAVYNYSKFDKEFNLNVQYGTAGYYEVDSKDTDKLIAGQREPAL